MTRPATVIGLAPPRPGSAPAPTRAKTPSGRYRLAAGRHTLDRLSTCPQCGEICAQRYDATQVIERDDGMYAAHQFTCSACAGTYNADPVARPDMTSADNLRVLERREPSATELRTRIAIADMWAENARTRGQWSESTARAREAFGLRRELFRIEGLCGRETE